MCVVIAIVVRELYERQYRAWRPMSRFGCCCKSNDTFTHKYFATAAVAAWQNVRGPALSSSHVPSMHVCPTTTMQCQHHILIVCLHAYLHITCFVGITDDILANVQTMKSDAKRMGETANTHTESEISKFAQSWPASSVEMQKNYTITLEFSFIGAFIGEHKMLMFQPDFLSHLVVPLYP